MSAEIPAAGSDDVYQVRRAFAARASCSLRRASVQAADATSFSFHPRRFLQGAIGIGESLCDRI